MKRGCVSCVEYQKVQGIRKKEQVQGFMGSRVQKTKAKKRVQGRRADSPQQTASTKTAYFE
jgi:hypothetical protein